MNAIIKKAHQIRKEAAVKFGGKASDYSLKIACEMAKNGEEVMDTFEEGRKIAREISSSTGLDIRFYDKGVYSCSMYRFCVCKTAKSKKSECVLSYNELPKLEEVEKQAVKFTKNGKKNAVQELRSYIESGNAIFYQTETRRGQSVLEFGTDVASLAENLDLSGITFKISRFSESRNAVVNFEIELTGRVFKKDEDSDEKGEKGVYGYVVKAWI